MDILNGITGCLRAVLYLTLFIMVPIFIIWLFTHLLAKQKSKIIKHKNFSLVLMIFGWIILFIAGISYLKNLSSRYSSDSSSVADGFTIETYKVKLNVNENNVVDVTEMITVDFYETGHHGIYKFVPGLLEYTGKDGNTTSRISEVQNLKAEDEKYSIDTVNGKDRIKIGSPDETLDTGLKTYTITYQYDMGEDPFEGFDEFIFHAYGDYWGTRINDASLEITMPKTIDENSITFFADKYRSEDITPYVDYYVSGNTLYANLSSDYDLENSLTVDIELPEGYFVGAKSNYGYLSLTLCLLVIIFAIIAFIKWLIYGKDYNKRYDKKAIKFYPPEGYDSADIGYIYKSDSGIRLVISIIIELASKGFIEIDELEDKKEIKITNLCSTDINKAINRKIKITKLKEADNSADEKLMNSLFEGNSTSCVINEDFDDFYANTKQLVEKGYIRINSDTINNYTQEELDEKANQIKEKAFRGKPEMTSNEEIIYNQLFANSDVITLSEGRTLHMDFNKLIENLQKELDDKINDTASYINMAIVSVMFFIGVCYFSYAFCVFEDLDPKFNFIYLLAFISLIVIFIFIILMKRKNKYGEQIIAEIDGFANYLETVSEEQVKKLVKDNPKYFYDILPYAYVLGCSKIWIGKFKNISISRLDKGNFDYYNYYSFNNLSNSIHSTSSSSSSSCGGGCSSCGGGCSSCGGGGSW